MFLFTVEIATSALSHLAGAASWGQKQDSVSHPRKSSDHTRAQEPWSLRGQMDVNENSMGGVGVGAELILSHPLNIFTKLWNLRDYPSYHGSHRLSDFLRPCRR